MVAKHNMVVQFSHDVGRIYEDFGIDSTFEPSIPDVEPIDSLKLDDITYVTFVSRDVPMGQNSTKTQSLREKVSVHVGKLSREPADVVKGGKDFNDKENESSWFILTVSSVIDECNFIASLTSTTSMVRPRLLGHAAEMDLEADVPGWSLTYRLWGRDTLRKPSPRHEVLRNIAPHVERESILALEDTEVVKKVRCQRFKEEALRFKRDCDSLDIKTKGLRLGSFL
ncbi:hypothetical protein QVD17_42048 [Tagetes erecta]|uniref:Uncharacterized protein n=1 Tax=Tagetes erecta TaxID=13708 RepID=A0AAD8JRN3_TARER|nr:hypothetical protein QVD17_42048 [Tagetes erecta]